MRTARSWYSMLASVPLAGCMGLAPTGREPLDCDVREDERRDPGLASCLLASSFASSEPSVDGEPALCIPASAFQGGTDCLVLDADASLCADGEPFDVEVFLAASGRSLRCNGQAIAHAAGSRARSGIRTPYEHSVSDILIEGCEIRDVERYGIDLKRFFRGRELEGEMQGHERISIEGTTIARTGQIGIYVGQNSRDVRISDVEIREAFTGIYLEAGSARSTISNVEVHDSFDRGGIHVDSSAENTIEDSSFRGNRDGAILLYKNCGELSGQVCPIRRMTDASHNTIRRNLFDGDGVAVAYRQFKTYGPDWCVGIDYLGHWRDRASDNLVEGNLFTNGAMLDIQDAPNVVVANEFRGALLELGAPGPVGDDSIRFSGTIAGNRFDPDSWIGVAGTASLALAGVEVVDNVDASGGCYREYRPRVSCSAASPDCYGSPSEIDGAVCVAD